MTIMSRPLTSNIEMIVGTVEVEAAVTQDDIVMTTEEEVAEYKVIKVVADEAVEEVTLIVPTIATTVGETITLQKTAESDQSPK